ncbi:hypothetical protein HanRHA438_Chr16g0744951 [Helianthus annuus]|nr:hypothetical protein HanHA300_Chr16g0597211 [Helianthus annuus]KAJ0441342.1 hypothetical protein HanIR_Chr16g0796641 [Helianthus annuus]KAJ0459325.1 hypothetical protein HanHA89_Chr16g0647681 [Helianthus annuus]KAJ0834552.1 hypothetical protein HanRHA438_Chr16g0744951 [Helianthus annuus]
MFCDIHCFFVFDRKHYFLDVQISIENPMMLLETNFHIYFIAFSIDCKTQVILVRSPLLLNCFVHCDTLWCRYNLQLVLITIERFMQTSTFEIVDSKFIQWMLLLLELIYLL